MHLGAPGSGILSTVLAANSRFNVDVAREFPHAVGRRFGALVESLGTELVQLVVERSMHSNAEGVVWAAGTNAVATRLPQARRGLTPARTVA